MSSVIAIDIGGTFTDLTAYDPASRSLYFTKSGTTVAPDEGAMTCMSKLAGQDFDVRAAAALKHGTTVVINSILERRGAKTALITTEGFRDILEIGRGNRPESFNLFYRRLPPLVPREYRYEVPERMSSKGTVVRPLDRSVLPGLVETLKRENIEAVAICFLHAYRNPAHELEVAKYIAEHANFYVSASHELSREFREYERTSTAVINAFVGPRTSKYVGRFKEGASRSGFDGRLLLMGSNGGVLTAEEGMRRPILLIESGPVGGAAGAAEVSRLTGNPNVIAFDMGGTTAKSVMIENGEAAVTPVYYAAGYNRGYPVQASVLDIIEVGAGGGSIAAINELGGLAVGPRSAGGVPGPACYGAGGIEPTVTDANLLLGRLNPDGFLGGEIKLDRSAAETAIGKLAQTLGEPAARVALGIINLATLTMASAVKTTTIERGHDPRDFAMVAYGGAGPLHAAGVARELGIKRVIVPRKPGHFCAHGMLYANLRYDLVQMVARSLTDFDLIKSEREYQALEARGREILADIGVELSQVRIFRYADMRYQGQEHTIKVRIPDDLKGSKVNDLTKIFDADYRKRYGHSSKNVAIDVVNFRVVVEGEADRPPIDRIKASGEAGRPTWREVQFDDAAPIRCAIYQRESLIAGQHIEGPAVIEEAASTTLVSKGDAVTVDEFGNLILDIGS
jgi:N-methylhydantoinase A